MRELDLSPPVRMSLAVLFESEGPCIQRPLVCTNWSGLFSVLLLVDMVLSTQEGQKREGSKSILTEGAWSLVPLPAPLSVVFLCCLACAPSEGFTFYYQPR